MINLPDFHTYDESLRYEELIKELPLTDQIKLRVLITTFLARAYNQGYESALDSL